MSNLIKQVAVYHLNADFDYREMQDFSRLDPDCLHTTTLSTPLILPNQVIILHTFIIVWDLCCLWMWDDEMWDDVKVTSCVRTMMKTFTNPVEASSAFGVFFGSLLPVNYICHHFEKKKKQYLSATSRISIFIDFGPVSFQLKWSYVNPKCYDMWTSQDWTDLDEGWMFGQWESGPWLGFHTKNNSFGSYGWVMAKRIW